MEPEAIKQAFQWGGWPAVAIILGMAFGRWYFAKKLEQDRRFHEERLKESHASQLMLGCVVDAIIALVYKTVNNEEAAKVMADLVAKRLETVRTAERVASQ